MCNESMPTEFELRRYPLSIKSRHFSLAQSEKKDAAKALAALKQPVRKKQKL